MEAVPENDGFEEDKEDYVIDIDDEFKQEEEFEENNDFISK